MKLIQIATSIDRGAYYYDLSTDKVYHVPHEELLELNDVRFTRLFGFLICSALVVIVIVEYASKVQYKYDISLPLLLLIAIFSSCIFFRLAKSHQKKINCLIIQNKNRYPILLQKNDLMQEIKQGCKIYLQIGVYIIVLFFAAILTLGLLRESPEILLGIFFVVFFDTGIMMLAILQPLGKILAYYRIRKIYHS